ncbi:hypothetical protein HK101_010933 [Irineochytrium annulatum]|nr:hypothetical protein HK101_010933 [Irineochytrium annulatum]
MTKAEVDNFSPARRSSSAATGRSQEASVAELAADRVLENRFPAIPIWVLLVLLMTTSIVAIVVPMALILVTTSNSSLNELTTITIQLAATEASHGVQNAISSTAQILDALMASPYFSKDFLAHESNVRGGAGVISAMMTGVRTFDYLSALTCSTPGRTAIGPYGPFTNRTIVQAVYGSLSPAAAFGPMALIIDPSTNASVTANLLSADYSTVVSSVNIGVAPVATTDDVLLTDQVSSTPSVDPFFGTTFINTTGVPFWQMSYYKNFWADKFKAGSSAPDFGCSVGIRIDESLTVFLNSTRVTNNTILMLMDTSGLLLSTNRPDSITTPMNATHRVFPDASPVPAVSLVGRALLSIYGSYTSIPTSNTPTVLQRLADDGTDWFLSTTSVAVPGTDRLMFVVAIPRSDLVAQMDNAEKRGVAVATTVACLGLIVTGLMMYLALRPLQRMATSMRQLTKLDFSFLENGVLNRRSPLQEIREVETVFDMMVKAFAGAIRRNKALMGGQATNHANSRSTGVSTVV